MDFSVLSRYDDVLANYFVDSLYLWFNTLRMNADFVGTQVDQQEIVKRFREHLMKDGLNLKTTVDSFLSIPYFKKYTRNFGDRQLLEFTQHMKRYLQMYRTNAGFEVGSTTRYTGNPEACIIATKDWKVGEQVTCCVGSIAALSLQDDLKLKKEGRDFSVMVSTRKKCTCLFLGPARFMNHDCDSNCEFSLMGHNAITFRVVKDIKLGEEMTVFYANHYFGEDNCECMCKSCERLEQGKFATNKEDTESINNSDSERALEIANSTSRRSGRKRKEISYKDFYVPDQVKRGKKPTPEGDKDTGPMQELTNIQLENRHLRDSLTGSVSTGPVTFGRQPPVYTTEKGTVYREDYRQLTLRNKKENMITRSSSAPATVFRDNSSLKLLSKDRVVSQHRSGLSRQDQQLQDFNDWLDNQSDISDDTRFKELSSSPKSRPILACCSQWKEFSMTRISEEPDLCGRCNRHYQIYGYQWPTRKIYTARSHWNKNVNISKQDLLKEIAKQASLPEKPILVPKEIPLVLVESRIKGKDRKKRRGRKRMIFPANYIDDGDPVVIKELDPFLPIIHINPISLQQRMNEKSLTDALQDTINVSTPSIPDKPHHLISLSDDAHDRQARLVYLEEQQALLLQLRDRLYQMTQLASIPDINSNVVDEVIPQSITQTDVLLSPFTSTSNSAHTPLLIEPMQTEKSISQSNHATEDTMDQCTDNTNLSNMNNPDEENANTTLVDSNVDLVLTQPMQTETPITAIHHTEDITLNTSKMNHPANVVTEVSFGDSDIDQTHMEDRYVSISEENMSIEQPKEVPSSMDIDQPLESASSLKDNTSSSSAMETGSDHDSDKVPSIIEPLSDDIMNDVEHAEAADIENGKAVEPSLSSEKLWAKDMDGNDISQPVIIEDTPMSDDKIMEEASLVAITEKLSMSDQVPLPEEAMSKDTAISDKDTMSTPLLDTKNTVEEIDTSLSCVVVVMEKDILQQTESMKEKSSQLQKEKLPAALPEHIPTEDVTDTDALFHDEQPGSKESTCILILDDDNMEEPPQPKEIMDVEEMADVSSEGTNADTPFSLPDLISVDGGDDDGQHSPDIKFAEMDAPSEKETSLTTPPHEACQSTLNINKCYVDAYTDKASPPNTKETWEVASIRGLSAFQPGPFFKPQKTSRLRSLTDNLISVRKGARLPVKPRVEWSQLMDIETKLQVENQESASHYLKPNDMSPELPDGMESPRLLRLDQRQDRGQDTISDQGTKESSRADLSSQSDAVSTMEHVVKDSLMFKESVETTVQETLAVSETILPEGEKQHVQSTPTSLKDTSEHSLEINRGNQHVGNQAMIVEIADSPPPMEDTPSPTFTEILNYANYSSYTNHEEERMPEEKDDVLFLDDVEQDTTFEDTLFPDAMQDDTTMSVKEDAALSSHSLQNEGDDSMSVENEALPVENETLHVQGMKEEPIEDIVEVYTMSRKEDAVESFPMEEETIASAATSSSTDGNNITTEALTEDDDMYESDKESLNMDARESDDEEHEIYELDDTSDESVDELLPVEQVHDVIEIEDDSSLGSQESQQLEDFDQECTELHSPYLHHESDRCYQDSAQDEPDTMTNQYHDTGDAYLSRDDQVDINSCDTNQEESLAETVRYTTFDHIYENAIKMEEVSLVLPSDDDDESMPDVDPLQREKNSLRKTAYDGQNALFDEATTHTEPDNKSTSLFMSILKAGDPTPTYSKYLETPVFGRFAHPVDEISAPLPSVDHFLKKCDIEVPDRFSAKCNTEESSSHVDFLKIVSGQHISKPVVSSTRQSPPFDGSFSSADSIAQEDTSAYDYLSTSGVHNESHFSYDEPAAPTFKAIVGDYLYGQWGNTDYKEVTYDREFSPTDKFEFDTVPSLFHDATADLDTSYDNSPIYDIQEIRTEFSKQRRLSWSDIIGNSKNM